MLNILTELKDDFPQKAFLTLPFGASPLHGHHTQVDFSAPRPR